MTKCQICVDDVWCPAASFFKVKGPIIDLAVFEGTAGMGEVPVVSGVTECAFE